LSIASRYGQGLVLGTTVRSLQRPIARQEFGAEWPFTAASGVLSVIGWRGDGAITFTTDGVTYALNVWALKWLCGVKPDPIWAQRVEPGGGASRVPLDAVLRAGLSMLIDCPESNSASTGLPWQA
jgi:hypothetical protein